MPIKGAPNTTVNGVKAVRTPIVIKPYKRPEQMVNIADPAEVMSWNVAKKRGH